MTVSKQQSVVFVGDTVIDCYVDGKRYVGGAATNAAVMSAQSGRPSALFSSVGSGTYDRICQSLSGVTLLEQHLSKIDGETATIGVIVQQNERRFIDFKPGVMSEVTSVLTREMLSNYIGVVVPVLGGLGQVVTRVSELVPAENLVCQLSTHSWPSECWGINQATFEDFVKSAASRSSSVLIGGNVNCIPLASEASRLTSNRIAILTCGHGGVTVFREGEKLFHVGGNWQEVVNTNGCGDAFLAGIALELLRNNITKDDVEFGMSLAHQVSRFEGPNLLSELATGES